MANSHHYENIDQYIATYPQATQDILQKVRQLVQQLAPEATEAISYNIPAFKLDGTMLIFFAGWKEHISLYPIPKGDDAFRQAIEPYVQGRGTLQFPLSKPIPYKLIQQVIEAALSQRKP